MQNGPKVAIGMSVVMVLALGVRVGLLYKERREPMPTTAKAERKVDMDSLVYRKKQLPSTPADEKDLIGKTVWVAAGGQLDYFADKGKHIDYNKSAGVLYGAEPLEIHEVFEEKVPPKVALRIPAGQKQVLLGFTLPHSSDPKAMYAMPVGVYDAGSYTFYSDDLLFYDDPHKLYDHWPAAVWQHIDKHEAAVGMTEDQVAMALGQVSTPSSEQIGSRSILFDNIGHPVRVEFEHGKATTVTPEK